LIDTMPGKISAAAPHLHTPPFRAHQGGMVFGRDESARPEARGAAAERVLVVEDDFLVATQMEAALTDAGFEIAGVAASADEAIALAASEQPVLCVMDIRLAGARDGIEAAIEIFNTFGIRSIFATAHADPGVRMRAETAVPLGWLQKPFSMASLVETVRTALHALDSKN
jgi:DNA-binding NarL/FixJ family response regulator